MAPKNALAVRNLGPLAAAMTQMRTAVFSPATAPNRIRGVDQDGWYSPLQPVTPIGPAGGGPKAFQFNAGQNLTFTPRFDSEFTADQLKELATYDLARVIIENVKDTIANTPWEIHVRKKPGEAKKDHQKREANDPIITKLSNFFECPDGENMWPDWVRPLIEDMLVIDAGSVLMRRMAGGKKDIAQLRVLRGESITRYIDENGYTPMAPDPAYAQNWWGMPLVNLSVDDLCYKPRNIVPRVSTASQMYGMSPVEQAAQWIRIGALRLDFQQAYYTDGGIPGVIHVVPPNVTPDKIAETMTWMASELAGNLAKRQQWRMVPGFAEDGKQDQIIFGKEALLADPFDDLIIRCLCFAFGTSPQRLMKMMNRASAETSQSAAEEEGYMPFLNWLRVSVMNYIIQRKMGYTDYEMTFDSTRESDPKVQMEVQTGYVSKGIRTPNEAREAIGDDLSNDPNADKLGIVTGTGFVPIDTPPQPKAAPGGGGGEGDGSGGNDDGSDGDGGGAGKPAAKKSLEGNRGRNRHGQNRFHY